MIGHTVIVAYYLDRSLVYRALGLESASVLLAPEQSEILLQVMFYTSKLPSFAFISLACNWHTDHPCLLNLHLNSVLV